MTDAFGTCLAVVLHEEGGWTNNPSDPGGETNLGVTKATWEEWTGKPASEADMRALTPAKVGPLYAARYWNANHCADLPVGLNLCVFDFGVNAGVGRAARHLQIMLGVAQDGQIGPRTIAAAQAYGAARAIRDYQQERRTYYRSLGTFTVFGRGWLARVDNVETAALRMIP